MDVGYDKHLRVKYREDEFVDAQNPNNHINGIESFWSYTKRRLQQFTGISKTQFFLFLKESEFRFNHRNESLHRLLLKLLRTSLNQARPIANLHIVRQVELATTNNEHTIVWVINSP